MRVQVCAYVEYTNAKNLPRVLFVCFCAAASGMGLCYAAIHEYTAAIEAFETAMTINPRLTHLRHHIMQLKQQQRDENRQQ